MTNDFLLAVYESETLSDEEKEHLLNISGNYTREFVFTAGAIGGAAVNMRAKGKIRKLESELKRKEYLYSTEKDARKKHVIKIEIDKIKGEISKYQKQAKTAKRAGIGSAIARATLTTAAIAGAAADPTYKQQQEEMQKSHEKFAKDYQRTCDKIKKDHEEFARQKKEFDKIFTKGLSQLK